jgi:signal transduction histidine kinase
MFRYFRALDPRRSLSTAVAWLVVVLSLAISLALVAVGDYATNSMLAQRDEAMRRFAAEFAGALDLQLQGTAKGAGGPLALPPPARLAALAEGVRKAVKPDRRAHVLLVDERQRVVFEHPPGGVPRTLPHVQQVQQGVTILPGLQPGERTVVVAALDAAAPSLAALGLHVAVVQPAEERGQGGSGLQEKLSAISILLSITAALVGAAFARGLTRRLGELMHQVQRVARQEAEGIVEPRGRDEVAMLGRAFSRLLQALKAEHEALDQLTRELEERVQARSREVERLAADSRYAAVVRERLRLARDMHDTLAHSMMEMLVQVRTLRMLHAHDPARLADELQRAEEVARQGLKEAREAVSQMRLNAVRDLGLGAALAGATNRFAERTGLELRFNADPQAASFADPRAETVFRIAEEALRNIDRHAQAKHVDVSLRQLDNRTIELAIADDGVGFDPAAPRPGHYGVVGIREQAELIDAELEFCSAPGAGAVVRLRLPVGPEMARP